ncbi:MAG: hypothetical protein QME66_05510 [Candidatus Eisenbacteria bacterium]|nr:hypothetical protein [Candidatus Eisenbacteria bacterium]
MALGSSPSSIPIPEIGVPMHGEIQHQRPPFPPLDRTTLPGDVALAVLAVVMRVPAAAREEEAPVEAVGVVEEPREAALPAFPVAVGRVLAVPRESLAVPLRRSAERKRARQFQNPW